MFKRILVLIDGRPSWRAAAKLGVELAQAHGAKVEFFSVLPEYPVPMMDAPLWTEVDVEAFDRAAKAQFERLHAAAAVIADKREVAHGSSMNRGPDAAKTIIAAATRRRCQLIVVASEGRNAVARLLTGSVIPGLITAAPMPVVVCKAARRGRGR